MTKIDLDELECKNARNHATEWYDDNEDPVVVLALIARIRELESFLMEARGSDGQCGGLPHFLHEECDAILDKGAVLP